MFRDAWQYILGFGQQSVSDGEWPGCHTNQVIMHRTSALFPSAFNSDGITPLACPRALACFEESLLFYVFTRRACVRQVGRRRQCQGVTAVQVDRRLALLWHCADLNVLVFRFASDLWAKNRRGGSSAAGGKTVHITSSHVGARKIRVTILFKLELHARGKSTERITSWDETA